MFKFKCLCGKPLRTNLEQIGKKAGRLKCKQTITVPPPLLADSGPSEETVRLDRRQLSTSPSPDSIPPIESSLRREAVEHRLPLVGSLWRRTTIESDMTTQPCPKCRGKAPINFKKCPHCQECFEAMPQRDHCPNCGHSAPS